MTRKLTDSQVISIRHRYAANLWLTQTAIAREFGVGQSCIRQICTGTSFKHLRGPRTYRRYSSTIVAQLKKEDDQAQAVAVLEASQTESRKENDDDRTSVDR